MSQEVQNDRKGKTRIADTVLKYLEQSGGEVVYIQDVIVHTGVGRSVLQNVVRNLQKTVPQIVTVVGGRAWRWSKDGVEEDKHNPAEDLEKNKNIAGPKQNLKRTMRMFEEIRVLNGGAILAQDENGDLYRVTRLSF